MASEKGTVKTSRILNSVRIFRSNTGFFIEWKAVRPYGFWGVAGGSFLSADMDRATVAITLIERPGKAGQRR